LKAVEAVTVASVLVDEALESDGAGAVAEGRFAGITCCGCAPPDDVVEGDDDGGGEGKREAPPRVATSFV